MCREEKNKTLIVFKLYPELLLYISIETCVAAGLPGLRTYMCILSGICHLIVTKSQLYIHDRFTTPLRVQPIGKFSWDVLTTVETIKLF